MNWFWKKKELPTMPPKPEDRIEYGLGFACEHGHCQSWQHAGATTRSVLWDEQICKVCGEKSFPSVICQTVSPWWNPYLEMWVFGSSPFWHISDVDGSLYTRKFVRFLKEETVRLSDEIVDRLKTFAERKFADVDDDSDISYKNGLHDGVSMAAQYVLGELEEETNA